MTIINHNLIALFISSFLAATLIPVSSEIHLGVLLTTSQLPPWQIIMVATLGNSLGGMSSFALGYMGKLQWVNRYLRISTEQVIRLKKSVIRWGGYLAFFCWLPWIGDPLAVSLGLFRVNWMRVLIFLTLGKFIRYVVVALLVP
ncbi:MAG: DedA family protein [Bdellovibrionales bacterium]|nr:DedA family protein [Bdellovibrionales bacterium]MBT3526731.1 DedA family protein [Bdellovibrionales bacterium]MBT7669069.1 DedA family protein [Bdellovibrionales bacterium]MBT7765767.1 DedA family protein [Bdellovibrionales bacterium]